MDDDQQIQDWLSDKWRESPKGAIWRNIGGYNVSVMPDDKNDGDWKAHIVKEGTREQGDWFNGLSSERDAKLKILKELLRIQARP